MRLTAIAHYLMPFVALAGGISVLLMPRLLNYIVAIYLILVGFIGLNSLFHFVR
jgi:energy-converting hydrogenase Eha subunit C